MPKSRHQQHLLAILFFFNDTATTEIYTLSLHDALPIAALFVMAATLVVPQIGIALERPFRSEEHTSELQSRVDLVCRLLLEKTKKYCSSTLSSSVDACPGLRMTKQTSI